MEIRDLIDQLVERRQDFSDITEFSANLGIYTIFCNSGRLYWSTGLRAYPSCQLNPAFKATCDTLQHLLPKEIRRTVYEQTQRISRCSAA